MLKSLENKNMETKERTVKFWTPYLIKFTPSNLQILYRRNIKLLLFYNQVDVKEWSIGELLVKLS